MTGEQRPQGGIEAVFDIRTYVTVPSDVWNKIVYLAYKERRVPRQQLVKILIDALKDVEP